MCLIDHNQWKDYVGQGAATIKGGTGWEEGGNKGISLPPNLLSKTFHHGNHLLACLGFFSSCWVCPTPPPLLKLNAELEKIKTAMEKFPLGYLVLPLSLQKQQ